MRSDEIPPEIAESLRRRGGIAALSGAGISVESGIPDFRSPGGLWEEFDPSIYASISTFLNNPDLSWKLFRAIAEIVEGKEPNEAHLSLGRLERCGKLETVITQNIDSLHQKAGNNRVIEVHGDHRNLECIGCGALFPVERYHLEQQEVPRCSCCSSPLKPNVVLFGEAVRHLEAACEALDSCDTLFVIGTSAQVYPVASLPYLVKEKGGLICEFNLEYTPLTHTVTDYFFNGSATRSLPIVERILTGDRGIIGT